MWEDRVSLKLPSFIFILGVLERNWNAYKENYHRIKSLLIDPVQSSRQMFESEFNIGKGVFIFFSNKIVVTLLLLIYYKSLMNIVKPKTGCMFFR